MRAALRGLDGRLAIGAAVLVVVVAAAFAVTLRSVDQLHDANRDLARSLGAIAAGNRVERLVVDSETAQRGYIITANQDFLEPYEDAKRELPGAADALLAAVPERGSNGRRRAAEEAVRQSEQYVGGYVPAQITRARTNPEQARRMVAGGTGKRQVDAIRAEFTAFERAERTYADMVRHESDSAATRALLFALLGLILCPVLVVIYGGYLSRLVVAPIKRVAAAATRRAQGDWDARAADGGIAEAHTLISSFNEMAEAAQHSRDELEHQNAELEAQQGELERTLEELAREKERGDAFHRVVARISAAADLDELAAVLLSEIGDALGADAGTLYALDVTDPDGPLLLSGVLGFEREQLPRRLRSGAGLAGRALAERRAIHAQHDEGGLTIPAFGGEAPIRQELHLPLPGRTRVAGVISFGRVGTAPFPAPAIDLAGRLAEPAAVGLVRALATQYAQHHAELNQAVLETAQDAYVASDQDGVVLEWSPQAQALFGYTAEQATGRPLTELIVPDAELRAFDDRYAQVLADAEYAGARTHRFEQPARRADGSELTVEISLAPLRIGTGWRANAFVRDVTGRRLREREREARGAVSRVLAEVEGRAELVEPTLAALGEAMEWPLVAFWLPEVDGRLACAGLWRCEPSQPAAERALAAVAEQVRAATHERGAGLAGRVFAGGEANWTSCTADDAAASAAGLRISAALPVGRGPHALGVLQFWQHEGAPPDAELLDTLDGIAGLVVQVAEKRAAEAEADRLKNEFFALVSHELRTPLTSIVGYVELVIEEEVGEINEQQRRFLEIVERNGRRLQRLVGDLLFVAQVEAGTLNLEHGRAQLERVVQDAVDAARPRAEQARVEVTARTEPVPEIRGDAERLGQLVDNLINNALKFTPAGGSVSVTLRDRGEEAELAVTDTGIGIPPDEQARLFDRFFRASTAVKEEIPGIGLGLSICQAIAEGHGGRITVESEVGRGTTFRVLLPLRAQTQTETETTDRQAVEAASGNGARQA
ncbi:ATP-binding protein [Conexibacter sp. JD483]|uniref:ATP-binding protein n=1 Tax=unclassified Conexibacter TaxID=2627773 RepID=UPI0027167B46|nr:MULTISPECIES: ATP-binding protein [unclassified Conexibacter]MDO8184040.1 ATP-binding protein [Conexibacter sp. CPCC 205706]MDO8197032.1 ATP-binding protein [Conexibacter sp. CPCC 205762]MDR9367948.1 ATP-binding protein [Conexibacter sp. JD483]